VIIVLTLTLPAAEVLLRVLRAIDAVWFAVLAVLLLWASRRAGAIWACRVVRLVHTLPFVAIAYVVGAIGIAVWQVPLSAHVGGAVCAAIVLVDMAASWWREWWRG
jgi:hypothetical protein